MTTTKRGVNVAIDYLNSFFPVTLIPDKLFQRAGCEGKVSSLERNLRKAAKAGRVKVIYERDQRGDMIAHYQGVPRWTPNDVVIPPPVYFYEFAPNSHNFSPYYDNLSDMKRAVPIGGRMYTGTHENPVEIKKS